MKDMINIDNLNSNWFVCLISGSGPKAFLQILAMYCTELVITSKLWMTAKTFGVT